VRKDFDSLQLLQRSLSRSRLRAISLRKKKA